MHLQASAPTEAGPRPGSLVWLLCWQEQAQGSALLCILKGAWHCLSFMGVDDKG
jgi:hypothetical protein